MINQDYYGDQYKWFIGVVKEIADNDRVKVRIFGIHRMDDNTNVSDGDLPLAMVMYPVNSSGGGHALTPGKWVCGFFADGEDCQQPIVIGVFKGGAGAADNSSSSSPATAGAPGTGSEAITSPGTNTADTGTPTASPSNLAGGSNAQKVYNFVRERIEASGKSGGDIHAQCSAIVAAMNAESGCNPNAATMDTNNWPSKGLCQWNKERLWKLERRFGVASSQQDKNTKPLGIPLEDQLAYFWDDFSQSEKRAYNMLMSARNPTEATDAMIAFERPGGVWAKMPDGKYGVNRSHPEFQKRLKGTMDAMSKMKYKGRQ